jgi:MbtH protein
MPPTKCVKIAARNAKAKQSRCDFRAHEYATLRRSRADHWRYTESSTINTPIEFSVTLKARRKKVTNPFEDEDGTYHVLINDEGQHSLWPAFVEVPKGWTIIHKADKRAACLEFIEKNWTDLRPKSLIESMNRDARSGPQLDHQPTPATKDTLH